MWSHFEHEILLQPSMPTIYDNYYSLNEDPYCHNYQHPPMVDEEVALMVPQKEDKFKEEINASSQVSFHGDNVENRKANESKKKKRKRITRIKSSEEVENQRMIHIEVERNRRKQMNAHLHVLKSLMPSSYVQRVLNSPYIMPVLSVSFYTILFFFFFTFSPF